MFASRHTPKYKVKVEGQQLPPPLASALREIHVDRSVEMADMAVLTFQNAGSKTSDEKNLQPGKKLEIELGYEDAGGQTQAVFEGEIVAITGVFPRRGASSVRIQAYTKHHRLQRGRFVRCFSGLTYSGIAQKIAQEVGLEPMVDATSPAQEMVFQRNQTNLELLLELASRVGYEVFAGDGKLFFRKPVPSGASVRKLKKGESLMTFNPRVQAALVPNEVSVMGWDFAKKEAFAGGAKKGDEGAAMGGKTNALAVAEKLGKAVQAVRETSVADKDAADELGKAILRAAAENLVHASASVTGSADLKPGLIVELEDVGDVFSGPYYINRVVHNFLKQGFTTSLSLRRSSIEKQPAPPPPPVKPPPVRVRKLPPGHEILARIIDEETGKPHGNTKYEVVDAAEKVIARGITDWQGAVHHIVEPGQHTVRVAQEDDQGGGAAPGGATQGNQAAQQATAPPSKPGQEAQRTPARENAPPPPPPARDDAPPPPPPARDDVPPPPPPARDDVPPPPPPVRDDVPPPPPPVRDDVPPPPPPVRDDVPPPPPPVRDDVPPPPPPAKAMPSDELLA